MKNATHHTVFVLCALLFFVFAFGQKSAAQDAPQITFDGFQEEFGYAAATDRALFGIPGQAPIAASVGETFAVGPNSFTVRNLDANGAVLYSENDKRTIALPLSAVGLLRSQVFKLEEKLWNERRRAGEESGETDIRTFFLYLILGHILVYGFILVGMLTLPPFRVRRPRRRLP